MNKIAILFPGQGSQRVGMLAGLLQSHPDVVGPLLEEFKGTLSLPIEPLITSAPTAVDIDATEYAQPAILATSIAYWRVWMQDWWPLKRLETQKVVALGHSVGEYSALVAAGLISLHDGLDLRRRGMAIKDAVKELSRPFGMWVLSLREGASVGRAVEILSEHAKDGGGGDASISSINSTSQIVISGYTDSLSRMVEGLRNAGMLRHHRPLQHVSAPFHSPLLTRAAERFAGEIASFQPGGGSTTLLPKGPISTIISNLDARPAYHNLDDPRRSLGDRLSAHITKTVLWQPSIEWCLRNEEIGEFWQMGPGSVLYDLLRPKASLTINVHCFSTLK